MENGDGFNIKADQLFPFKPIELEENPLYTNSFFRNQLQPDLTFKYSHLNSTNDNLLLKLRNYQLNNPQSDQLNLPNVSKSQNLALKNYSEIASQSPVNSNTFFTSIVSELTPEKPQSDLDKDQAVAVTKQKEYKKWKLKKIVLAHEGHVTSLCIDPEEQFYVSGSNDKSIKIWDINNHKLQLTLRGHIMAVRGLKVSPKHPYLFSCSEDKTVKCWDLEKNLVIRDYHGHLSAVYTLDLEKDHNDLLLTGGRDSSVRVWDIRTRNENLLLSGHKLSVTKVQSLTNNEVISSSLDSTVKKWDLRMGKCITTLTNHSKGVRSFGTFHDKLITGSTNGFKQYHLDKQCQYIKDLQYFDSHSSVSEGNIIVNSISINEQRRLMFAGCDDGHMGFWDLETGCLMQQEIQTSVPGSIEGENGVLTSAFDLKGDQLIMGLMDKSIRIYT